MTRSRISWALLGTLGLGLAVAVGVRTLASGATFDPALVDKPCEIVTAEMVATTFGVPVDDLKQSSVISRHCNYKMDEDDKTLKVQVVINAYDTDEDAAKYFRGYTRSMSEKEISDGMKAIKKQVGKDGDLDTEAKKDATEGITSGLMQGGIQFEDVDGVADQARLEASDGTLHLQQGNLLIKLSAFYGPDMQITDDITSETIMKAVTTWQQDTMTERREQAIKLAKVALAAL